MVALNVCAVTALFEDGEKRKPGRIVKLYVLPPLVGVGTASATSGTICDAAGAGLSGYVTRFAQVASKTSTVEGSSASAGSSDEKSSCSVKCAGPPVTGGGAGAAVAPPRAAAGRGATVPHTWPAADTSAVGLPPR